MGFRLPAIEGGVDWVADGVQNCDRMVGEVWVCKFSGSVHLQT
jgi:hypothetical protein